MAFQYHVREMTAETSVDEFETRFVPVEKFLPFCQQCGSYNTRWTCPPFDFDPMTIWQSYRGLRLCARILQADTPEQPLDEAVAALKQEKRLYRQELQRWEQETPGSQMLLAGTCDQCEVCEKAQGRPCSRPELLRCGGLFAALLPSAYAVGQGWQSAGLLCTGGWSAHQVTTKNDGCIGRYIRHFFSFFFAALAAARACSWVLTRAR